MTVRPPRPTRVVAMLLLVAVSLLCLPAPAHAAGSTPQVLPRKAHPYGQSYGEWNAAFWKWFMEQPLAGHPGIDDPAFNVAGGQSDGVWFLAGVFGTVSRTVTVPEGTPLFIAIAVAEGSDLEGLGATEAERRASAEFLADHIVVTSLFCVIDGVTVRNLASFRTSSPEFSFTAPTPWIFGDTGGEGLAVGDGYFIMLAPLSIGAHTIHFGGAFHFSTAEGDPFDADFSLDDTYHVTVQ
jgi:hypothetical protein